jgi:hypothetical protein
VSKRRPNIIAEIAKDIILINCPPITGLTFLFPPKKKKKNKKALT